MAFVVLQDSSRKTLNTIQKAVELLAALAAIYAVRLGAVIAVFVSELLQDPGAHTNLCLGLGN